MPPTPWEHPERIRYLNPKLRHDRSGLVFFAGPANTGMSADEPWAEALYSFGARQV